MPTISAKLVLRPKVKRKCDGCSKTIGPHVHLFGGVEGDRPGPMRLCIPCASKSRALKEPVAKFRKAAAQAWEESREWVSILDGIDYQSRLGEHSYAEYMWAKCICKEGSYGSQTGSRSNNS